MPDAPRQTKIPHHGAYAGERNLPVTVAEDGSITIEDIGYYEDSVTVTADQLRQIDTCIVSRTLLRRVTADLEYLAAFIRGQIQNETWIGLLPGHPEGTLTIAERCTAAHALAAQVMTAGNITEDEDLDD